MLLAHLSWPDVERTLEKSDTVILPIGSTEQHGPNGLCGTDHLTAGSIAQAAGEAAGILVTPVLAYGMATHHMGFPGTVTLRPSTLLAVVLDIVSSLHRHGFRGFYFVNGHGGNIGTLEAAQSEVHHALADCRFRVVNWWRIPEVQALEKELYCDRNGSHATPSEIALTMHIVPGAVKPAAGPFAIERPEHAWPLSAEAFRATFPDGRMRSDPSLARAEHGARILDLCVRLVTADALKFAAGRRFAAE